MSACNAPVAAPGANRGAARDFSVTVRREGRETHSTVRATDWYGAFLVALEAHGHDCRIEVQPARTGSAR